MTRTISLSVPSPEQRLQYTLVLKGHIALAMAEFPLGTRGYQLDVLARQYLWEARLDYPHGTGHGVGSYLSVHEGPQRISPFKAEQALLPGMLLSNEPGFYQEGAYGIRLENIVLVEEKAQVSSRVWLGFHTLTLVPFDVALIDVTLLSSEERAWLNAYHQQIAEAFMPALNISERAWLEQATQCL